jgi:hypothetical protein
VGDSLERDGPAADRYSGRLVAKQINGSRAVVSLARSSRGRLIFISVFV